MRENHPGFPSYLVPVSLAAVFGCLSEQLGLQGEDVVQDAIDPPSFEAMVGDHTGVLEVAAQGHSERPIDARLPPHLRILEQL
jgi:hypothetical protein